MPKPKREREKLKRFVCVAKRFRLFHRTNSRRKGYESREGFSHRARGMGSESRNRNGDAEKHVAAENGVPATAAKVVRSVKEIVNCAEEEIYAALKECDMDVNRAVEKLLAQDTFHEVRSKRDRRKEGASNSKTKGNNVGSIRGVKSGTSSDSRVVQSGLTYETYNEHEKAIDKGEGGSVYPSVMPPTTHVERKNTKSDSFSTNNGRQSLITSHPVSDSVQASSGPRPSMTGVSKGRLSMADIVRMGRTSSQDTVSHDLCNSSGVSACENSESSLGLPFQNHSEQQIFHDEWPIIEQPIARNSQALKMSASSNANGPFESMNVTATCLHKNCELDAAPVSWGDVSGDDAVSASISSKHSILSSNTGLQSHSYSNLGNTLSSDLFSSHGHHEDVSSAATIFQKLSIGESKQKVPTFEDDPEVIIPTHLQALGAECSHLSFGTYNGSSSSASSVILTSNHISKSGMEEKSAAVDNSSTQFQDASSVYHGDKQLGFDVLRGAGGDKNNDFLPSPKQWHVNHIVPEETFEHERNFTASVSDPSLQNSHWVNTSLPFRQPDLQSGNQFIFPKELYADSNSIPDDVLAFLMTQSQPARHSNTVSSISNPAISMSQVMEPGAFTLPKRSAVSLSQGPTVHSTTHFHQLPDTNRYLPLPQNKPYITSIDSQQAFSGHTAYNQSPADMNYNLSQNRNEFLTSRLPHATARDAFGYGNLGSSIYSPGSFLSNPSLGRMMPSSNLNEVLPSQYNGGHNGSSIQQHGGSFSHWDYEAESRSSFIPERTQYNFLGQQPNQGSLPQYASPGYSNLYHSQTRVLEQAQQPGGFQDLSSEQLHQFWKHSH
ncbi:uncharacterized protein LOC109811252 isoform X2 [Cajanus cajan]|uniref:uncharacterized protein LOC109811252 isoform X2 n=1 Tax=Cajanus cajan TaxID=3821 RepID=UPI00098D9F65|nr:uncharacterized protein LOC109811252 isoform X2 [Cajanus cajan]